MSKVVETKKKIQTGVVIPEKKIHILGTTKMHSIIRTYFFPFIAGLLVSFIAVYLFFHFSQFKNTSLSSSISQLSFITNKDNRLPTPTPFYVPARISVSAEKVKEFLTFENYLFVDPYVLKRRMDAQDKNFQLIDLRSAGEFKKSHMVGAINIPTYDTSGQILVLSERKSQIVEKFNSLNTEKELILYGPSSPSGVAMQVALFLWENGIQCKILRIGWNEWRHFQTFWLPEDEWGKMAIDKYTTSD